MNDVTGVNFVCRRKKKISARDSSFLSFVIGVVECMVLKRKQARRWNLSLLSVCAKSCKRRIGHRRTDRQDSLSACLPAFLS